jgi:hypothetical protein
MKCAGNGGEFCGGNSRLSVYNYTVYVPPYVLRRIWGGVGLQGCRTDSVSARGLSRHSFTNGTGMTEELCLGTCQAKGYSMAGIEYGKECYCGNVLAGTTTVAPGGMADCQVMLCPGNMKEICAAGNRLLIYSMGSYMGFIRLSCIAFSEVRGICAGGDIYKLVRPFRLGVDVQKFPIS